MPNLFLPKPPKGATAARLRVFPDKKAILRIKDLDCIKGQGGLLDFGNISGRGSNTFIPIEGSELEWDGWGKDPNDDGEGNAGNGEKKVSLPKSKV